MRDKRKSMTAYGRGSVQTKQARWTIEISSVNRKGLDLHIHLPASLTFLDPVLRKWIAQIAERGNITIRVSCEVREVSHLTEQLKGEKKRWEEVAKSLHLPKDQITLPFLLTQVAQGEVKVDSEKEILEVWKLASKAWMTMKEQEGSVLERDIGARLKTISLEMKGIEKELPEVRKEHLAKLSLRMEELKLTVDWEQLQKEAALQADRDDVTEELIRLKSHMEQMELYLKSKERSVGRTLDFLAQEMGREIGTLMAKAGSSEIARRAVKIKSEVEKIREQVQNIE